MVRTTRWPILLAGLLLGVAACQKKEVPSASAAPDFTLNDVAGARRSLSDFRGKVVLLDFWATWCPPCRVSIPVLQEIHKEYESRGLAVVGVSVDQELAAVAPFVREQGITYPVLLGGESDVSEVYQVRGIPTVYLLDKEGRVVRHWVGFDPGYANEWRRAVEKLL